MSYLLDKKIQRKKFLRILFFCVFLLILFYFRLFIFNGLSSVSHKIFHPVLVLGANVGEKFKSLNSFLVSKNSLYLQNQDLQMKLKADEARISNYNSLLAENVLLKEILGRKSEKINMTLAAILSKPNQNIYDVFVIDIGAKDGVRIGDLVFALGNVPVGRVSLVYDDSAKVTLFSNPGEKTQVVSMGSRDVFMEVTGRGGGNFEMIIPSSLTALKGDQVILPGLASHVLGIIETVISDPRDSFTKALLTSPVNIQELKFVEVEN
jgi:cell shape-determining protein MreC